MLTSRQGREERFIRRRVLIFGGTGLIGSEFIKLNSSFLDINSPPASLIDIMDFNQTAKFIEESEAEVVINFAAYTNVEEAEIQKNDKQGIAYMLNAIGAKNVANACRTLGKHLIHISTEYVFDGTKENNPYTEVDKPSPINWYGQTKYFGEQNVLNSNSSCLIIRLSMPYSAYFAKKSDIARFFLRSLQGKKQIKAVIDQNITPTYVGNIARAIAVLTERGSQGVYHVSSLNYTTPFEFAKLIAKAFKLDSSLINHITLEEYNQGKKAKLLKNSWLSSEKFNKEFGEDILHSVEESIALFKQAVDGNSSN